MQSKREWMLNYAKVGYVAKGLVYCLVGVLTVMYAFGIGGNKASKSEAFSTIKELPGGSFLLAILAVGLLGYSLWRFIQAFMDTEDKGHEPKGIGKRLAFAFSGLVYGSIAFAAFKMGMGDSGKSKDGASEQTAVAELLTKPFGKWLAMAVGLFIIGNGIYQLTRAFKGSFMKHVHGLPQDQYQVLKRAGRIGYASRGVVFGIIGYLFLKASWNQNPQEAKGTSGALNFLESSPFGTWLLGAVAIGLIGYGIFMFVRARYSQFSF